jgi:hypothetical protein
MEHRNVNHVSFLTGVAKFEAVPVLTFSPADRFFLSIGILKFPDIISSA